MHVVVRAAGLGALRQADLLLPAGRYVALSNEREPLQGLVALLSGRQAPRRGHVLLDGRAPAQSPDARRKLAALFHEEALPPARSVLLSTAKALTARGESPSGAEQLLQAAGLAALTGLAPGALNQHETRSVALALALAHASANVAVLYEPLSTLVPHAFVVAALDALTTRGALVLSATTSPADATLLGGRFLCVELGRVNSSEAVTARLGAGEWQQVLVETDDARKLSQLLLESAHGLSTELGASAQALKVSGPALDVTVRELTELARKHGIEIRRIEAAVPPVEALMAARAGFARGAYEAARVAALGGSAAANPPAQLPSLPPPPGQTS
jgi:ABC-type thiamine transport system ATPase subunit